MSGNPNPFACYDGRFMGRVLAGAVLLIMLSLTTRWLGLERGTPLRIMFALAQVIVLGYLIWITVMSIRKLDEMQHRVQLEAIAFAFATSAILMTGWGFMAKAGFPAISWGVETWMLMLLTWAAGLWVARRRYR